MMSSLKIIFIRKTFQIQNARQQMLPYPPYPSKPSRGGVLPSIRLTALCCWMESHFHGWIDNNGVAFSLELLQWDRTFSGSGGSGRQGFKNGKSFYSIKFNQCVNSFQSDLVKRLKQKVTKQDRKNYIFPKVTKMGSIFGHRIDFKGVGVLRGQRHIPSKN